MFPKTGSLAELKKLCFEKADLAIIYQEFVGYLLRTDTKHQSRVSAEYLPRTVTGARKGRDTKINT